MGYTTVTLRKTTYEKLKRVYKAHGGRDLFGTLDAFIDVLLDLAIETDTEKLYALKLRRDRRLSKHPELVSLLEGLRKEIGIQGDGRSEMEVEEREREEGDFPEIDIPPHQQL